MNILIVTGDKRFGPGHPRYELQREALGQMSVLYWGPGARIPVLPRGTFDVVTAQDPFWRGLMAFFAAKRCRARLNIQVHTDMDAQGAWRRTLAKHVLRRAHSIRVVSERIRGQVRAFGVETDITVLPVFTDVSRFKALVRASHEKPTILWIGRFEKEKDPLAAVRVLRSVRARIDARLIMLGAGKLDDTLCGAAEGLPVEFPGWQAPEHFLPETDVVLSTSLHESYGESIIEALAAGVPVVAPDVGVAKEAGAIVVPREELADAVAEVLTSPRRGELKLQLLNKEEWLEAFKRSLS